MASNWRDAVAADGLGSFVFTKAARWITGGFTHVLQLDLPEHPFGRALVNYTDTGLQTITLLGEPGIGPFPGQWVNDVEPD